MHCHGACTFSDGSKYVGEFADGLFDGQGLHVYRDVTSYQWQFKEGYYSGHGVLIRPRETRIKSTLTIPVA